MGGNEVRKSRLLRTRSSSTRNQGPGQVTERRRRCPLAVRSLAHRENLPLPTDDSSTGRAVKGCGPVLRSRRS